VALEKNAAPTTLQTTEGNSTAPNRLAMAMSMKSALTIDKPELAGLRALAPPRADRATVASYLSAFANEVSLTSRMVTALTDDDSSAIAQLGSQVQQGAANDEGLAQQYGFQVCSSSTG
jgi:hypothetical protein